MEALLDWLQHSAVGEFMRARPWHIPVVEIFHLAGLILVFGSVLIASLRMFNVMLRDQPAAEIARAMLRLTIVGLSVQMVTGPLLLTAMANKLGENPNFAIKIALLAIAAIYYFTLHRKRILAEGGGETQASTKASTALALLLWLAGILQGMRIGVLS